MAGVPVYQKTMTGFGYEAARRIFGLSNTAAFRTPTWYRTRLTPIGKPLIILPRMMEGTYATSTTTGRLDEEMKETLWTAMQLTSRAMYRWLTGKTESMDSGGYARSFIRRGMPLPADRPSYRLPVQPDPRYLPAGVAPGTAHLIDSVYISEDKSRMRSVVTHTREAYWAYFVEFGTVKMGAQPRWYPAAREARTVYLDTVAKGIDRQLFGEAIVAEITSAMKKRMKPVPYISGSVGRAGTYAKPTISGKMLGSRPRPLMGATF